MGTLKRFDRRKALKDMPEGLASVVQDVAVRDLAFFCEWLLSGRNVSEASRKVGISNQTGAKILRTTLKAAKWYVDNNIPEERREWVELVPEAKGTLRELLKSKDHKVRFLAAQDIVNRAEGKPVGRTELKVEMPSVSLSDEEVQLVVSLMAARQIGYAEAVDLIRKHPEDAQRWIERNALKTEKAIQAALPAIVEEAEAVAAEEDEGYEYPDF
jgi:hypothetical protein